MNTHKTKRCLLLYVAMMFCLIAGLSLVSGKKVKADVTDDGFEYEESDGKITITKYTGDNTDVAVPSEINGLPVTTIGHHAFSGCQNLTSIELPEGITTIEAFVFEECENLDSLIIPDSVTGIGQMAFMGCSSMTSLKIGSGVTNICLYDGSGSNGQFRDCNSLTEIIVSEDNNYYSSQDGCLFSKDKTELLCCPAGKISSYSIPDGVEVIHDSAFYGCAGLTGVTIPNGVTRIEAFAFSGCSGLTGITIPNSVTRIEGFAFSGCTGLTGIIIPEGVTEIFAGAFINCVNLENVEIPGSLQSIKQTYWNNAYDSWFGGCTNLKKILIRDGVESVFVPGLSGQKISSETVIILPDSVSNLVAWGGTYYCNRGSYAAKYCEQNDIPYVENPFGDVKLDKYYTLPVLWAYSSDPQITTGTSDTTFEPRAICNRAQVVTFLWRMMGCPEPTATSNPFRDVSENAYYYKAVLWAVEKNITTGKYPDRFAPKDSCNRAQFVTFLWRAAGSPAPQSGVNPFDDVATGKYYTDAVLWASENQITTGTDETHFSPFKNVSRGQAVTFLYRSKDVVEK